MDLNILPSLLTAFGFGLLGVGAAIFVYILVIIALSAVKQIPIKELLQKLTLVSWFVGGVTLMYFILVVSVGGPSSFQEKQLVEIKMRYGLELSESQIDLLEWPKSAPAKADTTIFGTVRLDDNVTVTLIWADGVYRLVNADSLVYDEVKLEKSSK